MFLAVQVASSSGIRMTSNELGGEAEVRPPRGDSEGRLLRGEDEGRLLRGEAEVRPLRGDSEGRLLRGETEVRPLRGEAEVVLQGRGAGPPASSYADIIPMVTRYAESVPMSVMCKDTVPMAAVTTDAVPMEGDVSSPLIVPEVCPASHSKHWGIMSQEFLAEIVKRGKEKMLIIDSRSFLEYNTCHIKGAINVCCSKLVKRRLQHDKVTVKDLLAQTCSLDPEECYDIVVYDQCSTSTEALADDCFLMVLLSKLVKVFNSVMILRGGFLTFQAGHPSLCETKTTCSTSSGNYKCTPLTSMSQPCMPVSNVGPTRILPFLYLGSQQDALSHDTAKQHGVNYVLNVSTTCPKPGHIMDNHFHRIPVNDNYSDKLSPHFKQAFQFIDKVREASGCVLVHCLAGISRSPTLAIAYVMYYLNISSEEAYKYVKDKRPTISPNFNFLGQLMEYEKQMKHHSTGGSDNLSSVGGATSSLGGAIRKEMSPRPGMRKSFSLQFTPQRDTPAVAQSPTTALARLNFNSAPSPIEETAAESPHSVPSPHSAPPHLNFPQFPTTSLDKLSFTPCFAKDEQSRSRHSSGNNNNNKLSSGGTKRPLSDLGHPLADCPPCSGAQAGTMSDSSAEGAPLTDTRSSSSAQVVCRSPESRAKRPLVRPNSIAFSSYPKFDFSPEPRPRSSVKSPVTERIRSPSMEPTIGSTPDGVCEGSSNVDSCRVEGRTIQMRLRDPGAGLQNMARKSQSLEDILNAQSEDDGSDWMTGSTRTKRGKHSHCMVQAADIFSQPLALDRVQGRCRGPSDTHQSSSSISSSGSHNSLQGSLEMIPVS